MVSVDAARRLALSLPESVEQDHFGNPSFRVRGRIFATVPDAEHLHVMIDPIDVDVVVVESQGACEELWWGRRLSGVRVSLASALPDMVAELLSAAWRRQAPRRLTLDPPAR